MIAKVNMYVHLKVGENWTTNMGDMAKSLFLQFLVIVVVVLVLQLEFLYLKNRKRNMSEILHTSRVR